MSRRRARAAILSGWVAAAAAASFGCRQDMHDQPKIEPLERSAFFTDGRGARPVPEGTISRTAVIDDDPRITGRAGGQFVTQVPLPVTKELLARGRNRFEVFCTPCHGVVGDGRGMVVKRGFPPPTSFHIPRLRDSVDGYLFDVITNGFGRMQGYSAQVAPDDRWAVVAYVRALQLSQNATAADVPAAERSQLAEAPKP